MPSGERKFAHVSDTALMVAACRALESDRADGLVNDPFAARLAGERGYEMAQSLPSLPVMCFGIGIRTRFADKLILRAIEKNRINTVLNLGAGLDSRPWRLNLPENLRWIEVDFAGMLDYKGRLLRDVPAGCQRESLAIDLTAHDQRRAMWNQIGTARTLILSEGLLMYLPAPVIANLAEETAQHESVTDWILELQSVAFSAMVNMDSFRSIQNVRSPESLDGDQIFEIINAAGWRSREHCSYITDVFTTAPTRVMELSRLRGEVQPRLPDIMGSDVSGVHLFSKSV